jgi:hypothetical protein
MSEEFEQNLDAQETQDFVTSLREFMDEEEVKELEIDVENESFGIKTKEQANFYVKKLQEAREQALHINETANAEIERNTGIVNRWREQQLATIEGQLTYLTGMLETYAQSELQDSSKKSIKLPHGTLQFRKQQDKFEYDDNALLEFLEANPSLKEKYVQYKPSAKKAELKKIGEVKNGTLVVENVALPGITVTKQEAKFEVK